MIRKYFTVRYQYAFTVCFLLHWCSSNLQNHPNPNNIISFLGGRWICCGPCVSSEVSSSAKMRLMPSSPRPVLPALLALTLAAFLPQLSSGATPFPQDLEPISIVGRECKFKICVAMVIPVAGVDVKVESLRYYFITGDHGLVRRMCLRVCLQQVNLRRFIQLPEYFFL